MDPYIGFIAIDLFLTVTVYFLRVVYMVFVFLLTLGYAYEGFRIMIDVAPRGRGRADLWAYMITLFGFILIDFACQVLLGTPLHRWSPRPFTIFP